MVERPSPGRAVPPPAEPARGIRHHSPYAGTWFPDDPATLSRLLDETWARSHRRTSAYLTPGAVAFVVPHAGLVYSGAVAAAAYRHMEQQRPERVVILGFCHRGSLPGLWIPEVGQYETPLGRLGVDADCVAFLLEDPLFRRTPESRVCDHSIEIQLPLLYRAAPSATLVPVYVAALDSDQRAQAAERLARCAGPRTVFLASSDLTHFGSSFGYRPFPVDARTEQRLRDLDFEIIDAAGSLSEGLFLDTIRRTSATVCGSDPISLLLAVLRGLDGDDEIFQNTLDYQTSGEITGDFHHSVSYGALGYFPWSAFRLGPEEQAQLLRLARETLSEYLSTGRRERRSHAAPPANLPALTSQLAVFVSLHSKGQLRGCLGRNTTDESLWRTVPDLALAAATEDRRFPPLSPGEEDIEIEISVLSPMKRIEDRGAFRVNEHGALLEAGGRHGLLLPQVATERNWGAEQFFEALARKANVSPSVYADPSTRLHVFRAQIIH